MRIYLLLILFPVLLSAADGGYEMPSADLVGQVTDADGKPLIGASVVLVELNTGTYSDELGRFTFKSLRFGKYTIRVQFVGFASQSLSLKFTPDFAVLDVVMLPTHIELMEVTVHESITGRAEVEKSVSVTVANRNFFSGSTDLNLMQSLRRIPGVNAMDIGAGMSKPVLRGLGFNRLIVAQNNIKQQGQQWGADHGLEIDMYGVERVEVVKGPSSLAFGSDAIAGAINIRPPVVPQENSAEGEVILGAQSNNDMLGISAMGATSINGKFGRIRISHQQYADYRVPANEFVYNNWIIPIPGNRLKNTSGSDFGMSIISGIRGSWGISTLTVSNFNQQSGFFPASHGIPNPGSLADQGDVRVSEFPLQRVNHLFFMSNTTFIAEKGRVELDFGFQQNHRQELNPPHVHGSGPLPEGNLELELLLNSWSLNSRYHHNFTERASLLIGVGSNYQLNHRGGYNFLLPAYQQFDVGVYTIINYKLQEDWFLNAGVRTDGSSLVIESFFEPVWIDENSVSHYVERARDLTRYYLNLAGSTGLSWLPSEHLNLKLNFGSSFRNPTPMELSANGVHHGSFRHEMGDASLQPERAFQLDLGFTWQQTEFYFHASPFVNYFPNFLFLNPSGIFSQLPVAGQIYRFEQAKALHAGGEMYTDFHITHALHTSVGGEWVWAQNLDNHYPLPLTPPASALVELNYSFPFFIEWIEELRLMSSVRSSAAQNRVARNEHTTKGYNLVSMGVFLKSSGKKNPVEITFLVNNLFNTLYHDHLSFYRILELPAPGRNYSVRISAFFIQ